MSPPNAPGVPGTRLPKVAQEIVARPRANSHADSEPPVDDGAERQSVVDFEKAVHAQVGNTSFHGPVWMLLVAVLLAAAVAVTYFVTRNSDASRPPQDEVLTAVNALHAEFDKRTVAQDLYEGLLLGRVANLESQNTLVQGRLDAVLRSNPAYVPINQPVSQALTQHK